MPIEVMLEKRVMSLNPDFMDYVKDEILEGNKNRIAVFTKKVKLSERPIKGDVIPDNVHLSFTVDFVILTPITEQGEHSIMAVQERADPSPINTIIQFHELTGWTLNFMPLKWTEFLAEQRKGKE